MRSITFQLLPYQVEVTHDDSLEAVMQGLANTARQPVEPRATLQYAVTGGGPYVVWEEGDRLATLARPQEVASLVSRRSRARLMDYLSLGGWVALHAGVLRVGGRRALVLGTDGSAGTALLQRLLQDGHTVEGGELVFARCGEAVCLPRPDSVGLDGRLDLGPVDVAFVLHHNRGGLVECRPLSAGEVVQAAVALAVPSGASRREVVRSCSILVGAVDGHKLTIGEPETAAELLVATCS